MKISDVLLKLIQYPHSPQPYRLLRDFYKGAGKSHEAEAIAHLLEVKFQELADDNNDPRHQGP